MKLSRAKSLLESAAYVAKKRGILAVPPSAGISMADTLSDLVPPLGRARARAVIARLKQANADSDVDASIKIAYTFKSFGIEFRPVQVWSEITPLLRAVAELKPGAVMEIGRGGGGTLFLFAAVSDPRATLLSVDLEAPRGWKVPIYQSFAQPGQRIELLDADSHDPNTRSRVLDLLQGRGLDFLFIDGDHSYAGVKKDFEMYAPLVNSGGMVAFHDIVHHPTYPKCEVEKFWNEVKQGHRHAELVEDWAQGWFGIGVLYL
jgi:predicted O-methyltransferase YrrM